MAEILLASTVTQDDLRLFSRQTPALYIVDKIGAFAKIPSLIQPEYDSWQLEPGMGDICFENISFSLTDIINSCLYTKKRVNTSTKIYGPPLGKKFAEIIVVIFVDKITSPIAKTIIRSLGLDVLGEVHRRLSVIVLPVGNYLDKYKAINDSIDLIRTLFHYNLSAKDLLIVFSKARIYVQRRQMESDNEKSDYQTDLKLVLNRNFNTVLGGPAITARLTKWKREKSKNLDSYTDGNIFDLKARLDAYNEAAFKRINLFFGTNRNEELKKKGSTRFGIKNDILKVGKCSVTIPANHAIGELERPGLGNLFVENKNKHISMEYTNVMKVGDFKLWVKNAITEANDKSALLFIHGFKVGFKEAALRTAQLATDLPFGGLAGFFSWPSSGRALAYLADIEKADASIQDLKSFIELFISISGIKKLHLIAHSMGNRLLTGTLKELSSDRLNRNNLKVIKQVVMAAADIDQNVFTNNILPHFLKIGERRTLYISNKDEALVLSKAPRERMSRIGDSSTAVYVADGIDSIDASNLQTRGNNHNYIFDTKELISDLYYLLTQGLSPIERRLKIMSKPPLQYYFFPA